MTIMHRPRHVRSAGTASAVRVAATSTVLAVLVVGAASSTQARLAPEPTLAERANLVYEMTDDITARVNLGDTSKVCAGGESVTEIDAPVRGGTGAFQHRMEPCGERAELSFPKGENGTRYLYGWSANFPADFGPTNGGGGSLIMQMSGWPALTGSMLPCKGVGHYMGVEDDGMLSYTIQRQKTPGTYNGTVAETECTKFDDLLDVKGLGGGWVDIVLEVAHSDTAEGKVNLWVKPEGQDWQQILEYSGASWFNGADVTPNLKAGVYTGDPNNVEQTVEYTTDEFRIGDAQATIADVSPDGTAPPSGQ
jgi:hypothetical protein